MTYATKVIGERTADCSGCNMHGPETCRVRRCSRCGEPCWVDRIGMRLVVELGAVVVCTACKERPDALIVVREDEFERAIDEARKARDARMRMLSAN